MGNEPKWGGGLQEIKELEKGGKKEKQESVRKEAR